VYVPSAHVLVCSLIIIIVIIIIIDKEKKAPAHVQSLEVFKKLYSAPNKESTFFFLAQTCV